VRVHEGAVAHDGDRRAVRERRRQRPALPPRGRAVLAEAGVAARVQEGRRAARHIHHLVVADQADHAAAACPCLLLEPLHQLPALGLAVAAVEDVTQLNEHRVAAAPAARLDV